LIGAMPTRRQEKVARVVKQAVSSAIAKDLSDPRITGFVSVTKVDMSPDLRGAEVYLSVFGADEKAQNRTFAAINHAKRRIQALLAVQMRSKFCPILHFYKDEKIKKTLETIKLIDQASRELHQRTSQNGEVQP